MAGIGAAAGKNEAQAALSLWQVLLAFPLAIPVL